MKLRSKLLLLTLLLPHLVFAVTLSVKQDGSGDYTAIQAAIDAACPGDTVLVYPGRVSLDIYNIKGQLVKNLYRGDAEIGSHSVIWNGKDNAGNTCASGVYFYKLRTSKTSLVQKMLLMK